MLREDEYPHGAGDVLALASAISDKGEHQPLPSSIRTWIGRALQLEKNPFATALEARDALDRVLSGDEDEDASETFAVGGAAEESPVAEIQPVSDPTPVSTAIPTSVLKPTDSGSMPRPEAASIVMPKPVEPAPASLSSLSSSSSVSPVSHTPAFSSQSSGSSSSFTNHSSSSFNSQPSFVPPATYEPAEFEDEDEAASTMPDFKRMVPRGRVAAVAVALVAVSTVGLFAARKYLMPGALPAVTGTLSINTNPPGATVVVDGQTSGITPLELALKPGAHNVELRGAGEPRTVPVNITPGQTVSQYIELPKAATAFGQLQVKTEPAGAQVTVDGIPRGKSPVLIEALAAGEHAVALDNDGANVKQTVTIEAGVTASLVVPLGAVEPAAVSGWVSVAAPVELQLYENKRLLGTSQSDRVMVTAGKHDIELVNDVLGYRVTRTVQVPAGKVAAIKVEWPKGTIAINALPWADVWIDGERVGETPIGNLQLAIGPHEILFRHPELGEQKYAATVTLAAPARVSVDLRKK